MAKLFIHSGAYKTGSSSIQLFLARNTNKLRADGLVYPKAGRRGVQHSNLVAELKGWSAFSSDAGGWNEALKEARDAGSSAIVSSESLSILLPHEMNWLGQLVADAGFDLVWIHYVREQSSLTNALYVERIVTMRPEFAKLVERSFEDFPDWSPIPLNFLDYHQFARNILDSIPSVELLVRPFVRSTLHEGDVVEDFCKLVGIAGSGDQATRTNSGIGWRSVESAKRITKLIAMSPIAELRQDDAAPLNHRLRRIAGVRKRLVEKTNELGWNTQSAVYASDEFRNVARARYQESNERLSQLIGSDIVALFDGEPDKPRNAGDIDEIPASDLFAVIGHIFPVLLEAESL